MSLPAIPAPAGEVTDDAFLGGALRILQPANAYRAGIDAVLLAAAIPAGSGGSSAASENRPLRLLDAGCGVGVVGLAAARRIGLAQVTMVEIAPALAALARENARRNELHDRVAVVEADVERGGAALAEALPQKIAPASFDHVVCNPPYYVASRSSPSPDVLKADAHAMPEAGLDAWMRFLAAAARAGGTATVIHRAAALPSLLAALTPRFGGLKILPLHARSGEPASRILVQGRKGSRAPLTLLSGLVLHGESHAFRPEIDAILRHGQPLTW